MPAFKHETLSQLHANIRTLYYRRQLLARLNLTHEEMIQTFVPAEARQSFRDVTPYCAVPSHLNDMKLTYQREFLEPETVKAYLRVHERPAGVPPMPRNLRVQPDAPQEIVDKITFWLCNGGDVSRDFGRVALVLNKLNELCSKQTMRYYWPTIIALCSENAHTQGYASELQELKTPANPKPLPRGLLLACKTTAETIATAKLIPVDMPNQEMPEASLEVATGAKYAEPDLGGFYGLT